MKWSSKSEQSVSVSLEVYTLSTLAGVVSGFRSLKVSHQNVSEEDPTSQSSFEDDNAKSLKVKENQHFFFLKLVCVSVFITPHPLRWCNGYDQNKNKRRGDYKDKEPLWGNRLWCILVSEKPSSCYSSCTQESPRAALNSGNRGQFVVGRGFEPTTPSDPLEMKPCSQSDVCSALSGVRHRYFLSSNTQ